MNNTQQKITEEILEYNMIKEIKTVITIIWWVVVIFIFIYGFNIYSLNKSVKVLLNYAIRNEENLKALCSQVPSCTYSTPKTNLTK